MHSQRKYTWSTHNRNVSWGITMLKLVLCLYYTEMEYYIETRTDPSVGTFPCLYVVRRHNKKIWIRVMTLAPLVSRTPCRLLLCDATLLYAQWSDRRFESTKTPTQGKVSDDSTETVTGGQQSRVWASSVTSPALALQSVYIESRFVQICLTWICSVPPLRALKKNEPNESTSSTRKSFIS